MPQVLKDRLDATARLAVRHPHNPVIVTGGKTREKCPTEAAAMAEGLRARGVVNPITQEDKAGNTIQNAENTRETIKKHGGIAVIVTSSPHNIRALKTFRAEGVEAVAYVGGRD